MEIMTQSLRKFMESVDLKTVTTADLKKKYIEEKGILQLSKDEKKLFSSAVKTAYLEFVNSKSSGKNEDKKEVIKETKIPNNHSDTSDEEPLQFLKEKSEKGGDTKNYSEEDDSENKSLLKVGKEKNLIEKENENSDVKTGVNLKVLSDSNDKPFSPKKKPNLKKSIISESGNTDEKPLINFSESSKENSTLSLRNKKLDNSVDDCLLDEEILSNFKNTTKKRSAITSSDSESEPSISLNKNVKKKIISYADDSEDELLRKVKKSSNASLDTDDSENEPLIVAKKAKNTSLDINDSEEEPLMKAKKTTLGIDDSENEPSVKVKKETPGIDDSEDEPLVKAKKVTSDIDDSEDKVLISLKKKANKPTISGSDESDEDFELDGKQSSSRKKSNKQKSKRLSNTKLKGKKYKALACVDDSGDEPLMKAKKAKKVSSDIDESEDEPLIKVKETNKASSDIDNSEDEPLVKAKKATSGIDDSEDEPLVKAKEATSGIDDSEDEPLVEAKKATSGIDNSEDEPLVEAKKATSDIDSGEEVLISNKKAKMPTFSSSDESDEDFELNKKQSRSKKKLNKKNSKRLSNTKPKGKKDKAFLDVDDSEDKPLMKVKNTIKASSEIDDSEEESLMKAKKATSDIDDSDEDYNGKNEKLPKSKKQSTRRQSITKSKVKKSNKTLNIDDSKDETLMNSKKSSDIDESEEEVLISLKKKLKKPTISCSYESDGDFKVSSGKQSISKKQSTKRQPKNKSDNKIKSNPNDRKVLPKRTQKQTSYLESSESDEEPLTALQKDLKIKRSTTSENKSDFETSTKLSEISVRSSDSEVNDPGNSYISSELLKKEISPNKLVKKATKTGSISKTLTYPSVSSSDEETLISLKKKINLKNFEGEKTSKINSSDSDEEPIISKKVALNGNRSIMSDSEEPLNSLKLKKSANRNGKSSNNIKSKGKKRKLSNDNKDEDTMSESSSSDSDEEPQLNMKKSNKEKNNPSKKRKRSPKVKMSNKESFETKTRESSLSDSGEEPLINVKKLKKEKDESLNNSNKKINFSDSDEEPLINVKKLKKEKDEPLNNSSKKIKKSPKVEPSKKRNSNGTKTTVVSSESESETMDTEEKSSNLHVIDKDASMKSEDDSSSDENDEEIIEKKLKNSDKNTKSTKSNKNAQKKPSASENKLENLKKYIRAAGIRVKNYNVLFENCKSMTSKREKLMDLLEEAGLKGRPTLKMCKKIKERNETKKEISELNTSNIISSKGRSKRTGLFDSTNYKSEADSTPFKKKFSRLQGIIDSEESE